jgi:hypothetical protein
MQTSKKYYLYLWRHKFVDPETNEIVERTCFGITGNPNGRLQKYEGSVGHRVQFTALWEGNERLIRDLEDQIKSHSFDNRVTGHRGYRYEWIDESIPYNEIYDWINLTLVPGVTGVTNCNVDEVIY